MEGGVAAGYDMAPCPHIAREWSVVLPVSRICGAISNGQSESPSHTRKKIKSLDYYRSRYLYYSNYMAM